MKKEFEIGKTYVLLKLAFENREVKWVYKITKIKERTVLADITTYHSTYTTYTNWTEVPKYERLSYMEFSMFKKRYPEFLL